MHFLNYDKILNILLQIRVNKISNSIILDNKIHAIVKIRRLNNFGVSYNSQNISWERKKKTNFYSEGKKTCEILVVYKMSNLTKASLQQQHHFKLGGKIRGIVKNNIAAQRL